MQLTDFCEYRCSKESIVLELANWTVSLERGEEGESYSEERKIQASLMIALEFLPLVSAQQISIELEDENNKKKYGNHA